MNEQFHTQQVIDHIISVLENSPWKDTYVSKFQRFRDEADMPCVLAVAGKVKAGKSSFLNALLGVDLAMVGTTETTATINYFTRVRDNILKSKEQKNIQPTKGGHKMVTYQNYVSLFYCQITSCPSDGGIS